MSDIEMSGALNPATDPAIAAWCSQDSETFQLSPADVQWRLRHLEIESRNMIVGMCFGVVLNLGVWITIVVLQPNIASLTGALLASVGVSWMLVQGVSRRQRLIAACMEQAERPSLGFYHDALKIDRALRRGGAVSRWAVAAGMYVGPALCFAGAVGGDAGWPTGVAVGCACLLYCAGVRRWGRHNLDISERELTAWRARHGPHVRNTE